MLYNDLKYVNVTNKIKVHTTLEFKNCNFQYIFLNWIISVIHGAKVTKFGHSEGTVSQISYLGLSFYSMKSRKLSLIKILRHSSLPTSVIYRMIMLYTDTWKVDTASKTIITATYRLL